MGIQTLIEGEISSILAAQLGFLLSVAVGTALASGPPHRLPHTALTSGSCNDQPLVGDGCSINRVRLSLLRRYNSRSFIVGKNKCEKDLADYPRPPIGPRQRLTVWDNRAMPGPCCTTGR
jgi:hypothetical protein